MFLSHISLKIYKAIFIYVSNWMMNGLVEIQIPAIHKPFTMHSSSAVT